MYQSVLVHVFPVMDPGFSFGWMPTPIAGAFRRKIMSCQKEKLIEVRRGDFVALDPQIYEFTYVNNPIDNHKS